MLKTKFNTLKTKANKLDKQIPELTTLILINQYNTNKQNLKKEIGDIDKKISDVSKLVTATVPNTKTSVKLRTKCQLLVILSRKQIATLKSLFLIITNLQKKYLMQR